MNAFSDEHHLVDIRDRSYLKQYIYKARCYHMSYFTLRVRIKVY